MKNITIDGVEYNITPVIKEIKKDYEILSVITNNNKFIEKVYNQDATIEPYWKIHSVKRLSDGEIFTIGDNTKYGCIDKFYIKNNYLLATTVLESNGRYLKDLEKLKQKLFTTEQRSEIEEIIKNIIK